MADRYRNWWSLSVNVVAVLLLIICAQTTASHTTTRGQSRLWFCYTVYIII